MDIVQIAQDFFKYNCSLIAINKTFLTLIPKRILANNVNDYRPKNLCNVVYKIISQVIANRLKVILPNIIGLFQSAFLKGGLISSILRLEKKIKSGIKLDMAKAYRR